MLTYESAVTVDRPPATVFPYVVDRDKQALWSDVAMRPLTEGPLRVGSQMELSFGKGPLKATLVMEVASLDPNSGVRFTTVSGPIDWTAEYRLKPSGATGTTLSQHGTMIFKGLWRLLQPMVGREIKAGEIKELERLKAAVESREPIGP